MAKGKTYGEQYAEHYEGFEDWINDKTRSSMKWKGKFHSPAEMKSVLNQLQQIKQHNEERLSEQASNA